MIFYFPEPVPIKTSTSTHPSQYNTEKICSLWWPFTQLRYMCVLCQLPNAQLFHIVALCGQANSLTCLFSLFRGWRWRKPNIYISPINITKCHPPICLLHATPGQTSRRHSLSFKRDWFPFEWKWHALSQVVMFWLNSWKHGETSVPGSNTFFQKTKHDMMQFCLFVVIFI